MRTYTDETFCNKHGEVEIGNIYISSQGKRRCKKCDVDRNSLSKKNNRATVNEWTKQDKLKNPEKYQEWQDRQNRRRRYDPLIRLKEVVHMRGMTMEQYYQMAEEHNNLCAICKQPETKKSRTEGKICRLGIDHCHETEKVRGLLCHDCNTGLGKFRDNEDLLQEAINYLRKSKQE